MKKSITLYLVLAIATCSILSFRKSEEKSSGNLGDVKYSVLAETEFIKENGRGWILLDDKASEKLRGSDLGRLGVTQLPDARGVFVRGVNFDRDSATGDVDAKRRPLSSQEDAFQGHWHKFEGQATSPDNPNPEHNTLVASKQTRPNELKATTETFLNRNYVRDASSDRMNGKPRTSAETRPRNISLYVYVKINN